MALHRDDVRTAYRLFLGRDPENEVVIEQTLGRCHSWRDLRAHFLSSREFREQISGWAPMDWPFIEVQTGVDGDLLRRMFDRVHRTWRDLGRSEPYWSVLSADGYRASAMDSPARTAEFYESGRAVAESFERVLRRSGVDVRGYRSCIDFGCGVGRVTQWLAALFESVVGVDVSADHLALARAHFAAIGTANVTLKQLTAVHEVAELAPVDVVFSVIVLQHNPPPVISYLVEQLLGRVNPGGVAYLQVPTYAVGYRFDAVGYLENAPQGNGQIEMHVLPQRELFRLVREAGCAVLETREDAWVGLPGWISNSVLVAKGSVRPPI